MAEHTPKPTLSKEVLAPQNPYSGLGVVLVASLAMFLAMASSAFVIRARMAKQSCPTSRALHQKQLPAAEKWHTPGQAPARVHQGQCGKPHYRTNPDGSVSVIFESCTDQGLDMTQLRDMNQHPVGIEVRRIH